MLVPQTAPPFPLAWGFSTKLDADEFLPRPQLSQVHGCGVVEAIGARQEGDGIWTDKRGLRIGVRVADCVPILLAGLVSEGRPWVAALHAGWRGAVSGILRCGVRSFQELGGDPSRLVFSFGPAIQACHFEVGEEVITTAKTDAAWRDDLRTEGPSGRPHLDLHGFLRAQALDLGLDLSRDGSVPLCTMCQTDLLWSYRRGDTKVRQWGWVEILA
ncbi:MAG TPA: polyphenol oxidase family protein [Holophagaceae bacterium]|jgi:YfiH family protein|nr:polyphenol oxidase family protein [Holophagaceae bacterium]